MTPSAEQTIDALSTQHEHTAGIVTGLGEEELTAASGATEWTVADALSHLGSGAEITLATLQVATGDRGPLDDGFNASVWDRWNALTPTRQRDGFLEHDAALNTALQALDAGQLASLEVSMGFLPAPLSVAGFAGMRLNEAAQHGWDVAVAADPGAGLVAGPADVLAGLLAGELSFLLGFVGKPDLVEESVLLDIAGSGYGLSITDTAALVSPAPEPTATFDGPLEAALRLVAGRLSPAHTPEAVIVTGNVDLDDLRRVFPGF